MASSQNTQRRAKRAAEPMQIVDTPGKLRTFMSAAKAAITSYIDFAMDIPRLQNLHTSGKLSEEAKPNPFFNQSTAGQTEAERLQLMGEILTVYKTFIEKGVNSALTNKVRPSAVSQISIDHINNVKTKLGSGSRFTSEPVSNAIHEVLLSKFCGLINLPIKKEEKPEEKSDEKLAKIRLFNDTLDERARLTVAGQALMLATKSKTAAGQMAVYPVSFVNALISIVKQVREIHIGHVKSNYANNGRFDSFPEIYGVNVGWLDSISNLKFTPAEYAALPAPPPSTRKQSTQKVDFATRLREDVYLLPKNVVIYLIKNTIELCVRFGIQNIVYKSDKPEGFTNPLYTPEYVFGEDFKQLIDHIYHTGAPSDPGTKDSWTVPKKINGQEGMIIYKQSDRKSSLQVTNIGATIEGRARLFALKEDTGRATVSRGINPATKLSIKTFTELITEEKYAPFRKIVRNVGTLVMNAKMASSPILTQKTIETLPLLL